MKKSIFMVLVAAVFLVSGTATAGVTSEVSFDAGIMTGSWDDNLSALDSADTEGLRFDLGYTLYFADLSEAPKPETAAFVLHPSSISLDYLVSAFSEDYSDGSTYESDYDAFSLSGWGYLPFGLGFGAGLSSGEVEYDLNPTTKATRDYDEIFYGISYYIANKTHRISLIRIKKEYGDRTPPTSLGYEDKLTSLQWTSLFGDVFTFELSYATGDIEYASGGLESDLDTIGIGFGFIPSQTFSIYLDITQQNREINAATSNYESETTRFSLQPVFWFGGNVSLGLELAVVRGEDKAVLNTGTVLLDTDEDEIEFGFDLRVRF